MIFLDHSMNGKELQEAHKSVTYERFCEGTRLKEYDLTTFSKLGA